MDHVAALVAVDKRTQARGNPDAGDLLPRPEPDYVGTGSPGFVEMPVGGTHRIGIMLLFLRSLFLVFWGVWRTAK